MASAGSGGDAAGAALRLIDLSVTLEDGTEVVKDAEVVIAQASGFWSPGVRHRQERSGARHRRPVALGEGSIQVESGAKMLLMPQRAYVPAGSLRRAATYPEPADSKEIDEVAKVLKQVGLGHLVDRLDEEGPWDQTLSGGEKQRWHSRASCCIGPTSSCSTRPRRRSTPTARTS